MPLDQFGRVTMRRSLTFKLTLAFLLVSLLGVGLVAVFSRLITTREFARLTQEQAKSNFVSRVSGYYQTYGSWQGINGAFHQPPQLRHPGSQPPQNRQLGWPVEVELGQENVGLIPLG